MQSTLALNIPHRSAAVSRYRIAIIDVLSGMRAVEIWGRLGWRETRRRYRRTAFGPFWTTASLAIFVTTLGLVWSNLWDKDPKTYLPYLTSGMLCWVLFSAVCIESCNAFYFAYEKLIKQLRISYTLLGCATVWRNVIVFGHNMLIYVVVAIVLGVWPGATGLLALPGFVLALILLFFLLALNLFGVFELGTSLVGLDAKVTGQSHGLVSSFLNGALATLAATPCTAHSAAARRHSVMPPPSEASKLTMSTASANRRVKARCRRFASRAATRHT